MDVFGKAFGIFYFAEENTLDLQPEDMPMPLNSHIMLRILHALLRTIATSRARNILSFAVHLGKWTCTALVPRQR